MDESNFVVKTIFHARGNSEVLTENYFATRKEAEEFCALTDYAMKLNYGAEQQLAASSMSAKVSGQAATACAKGSLSGFTHAVSFRAQRSETTGYAAIQSATERPAMHLAGETIADPPLYIKVKADDAPGVFCGALRVLNIKVGCRRC